MSIYQISLIFDKKGENEMCLFWLQEVVQEIEGVKTDDNDRPLEAVRINKCGELVPVFPAHTASLRIKKKKKPARSSSSSDSDSGVEKKKRKKAKKKEAKEERKRLEIEQAQKIEPQGKCLRNIPLYSFTSSLIFSSSMLGPCRYSSRQKS
jgi:hypothetical protein